MKLAGQMRSAMLLIGSGVLAVALTGCGAPRVHEVYRLSALEAQQAAPRQALNPVQQDLRRMTLQAQALQPRLRMATTTSIESLAALDPGNVHECAPGLLAQYDGAAYGPLAHVAWLGARPATLAFSTDGDL